MHQALALADIAWQASAEEPGELGSLTGRPTREDWQVKLLIR
jgi:hypothetical protein